MDKGSQQARDMLGDIPELWGSAGPVNLPDAAFDAIARKLTELLDERSNREAGKPEFFWSPPDGARIVGITTYDGFIVIATDSGVYTIQNGPIPTPPETWTVHKISLAVRQNAPPA